MIYGPHHLCDGNTNCTKAKFFTSPFLFSEPNAPDDHRCCYNSVRCVTTSSTPNRPSSVLATAARFSDPRSRGEESQWYPSPRSRRAARVNQNFYYFHFLLRCHSSLSGSRMLFVVFSDVVLPRQSSGKMLACPFACHTLQGWGSLGPVAQTAAV